MRAPQIAVWAGYVQYAGYANHETVSGRLPALVIPSRVTNTAIGKVNATSFRVSDLGCSESICLSIEWLRFFLDESPQRRQARTERPRPGFAPARDRIGPKSGYAPAGR